MQVFSIVVSCCIHRHCYSCQNLDAAINIYLASNHYIWLDILRIEICISLNIHNHVICDIHDMCDHVNILKLLLFFQFKPLIRLPVDIETLKSFENERVTLKTLKMHIFLLKTMENAKLTLKIYKKDTDISIMGVSALESHAAGKRHTNLLNERKKCKDVFFIPTQFSNANETTSQKSVDSSSSCTISTSKSIDGFMASRNSIDAEILWCMNVVKSHSFNFCSDLKNIFTKMFPDSDIATQCTLGKMKC